jgi:RNA polymerase sigma-70 factor (ECF subfamily)
MDLRDPSTFDRVYAAHASAVYRAALRVLGDATRAQDVAQDVFLRVWRDPLGFDPRRGELGAYLRIMARSRAVDVWRESQAATRARERMQRAAAAAGAATADRAADAVERRLEREAVRAALVRVPVAQREALVLAYWGGLTVGQIARRAGIPLGTAKSRLRLGLARLRAELAADGDAARPLAAA